MGSISGAGKPFYGTVPIRLRAKSENLGISPVPTKGNTHETHGQNPILASKRISMGSLVCARAASGHSKLTARPQASAVVMRFCLREVLIVVAGGSMIA